MLTKEELLDNKQRIDERSAELKLTLKAWKREARVTGKFRPADEIDSLESEIKELGKRSTRIQYAITLVNRAVPRGEYWFVEAAKKLLTMEQFLKIQDAARYMRSQAEAAVMAGEESS